VVRNEGRSAAAREKSAAAFASLQAAAETEAAHFGQSLEKLTDRLQTEKQARLSLDTNLRAWTEGFVRSTVEDERKERSEADKQETEARFLLYKDLRSSTDEAVRGMRAAVDEEKKERIDAATGLSYVWNKALAELGSTLRAEADEHQGIAKASREVVASSLQTLQATVTSLERGFETQSGTASAFEEEVRETLVDVKGRIAGTEDALQKLQKEKTATYARTMSMSTSMSTLKGPAGVSASYPTYGTAPITPRQYGSFATPTKLPSTPSTVSTAAMISPRFATPRSSTAGAA
jgi:hypothetical protein